MPLGETNARRDGAFRPVRRTAERQIRSLHETDGVVLPQPARKLRPRIDSFNYTGRHAYHVIMRTAHSQRVFEDSALAANQIETLHQAAQVTGLEILAYCLMPNHLHMLAQGLSDDSDLRKFVHRFKQLTSFYYKKQTGKQLWQTSFYDRALRREDNLQVVADYIFTNPVKNGLVSDARSYALSGGTYFDAASPDGPEGSITPDVVRPVDAVVSDAALLDGPEGAVPTNVVRPVDAVVIDVALPDAPEAAVPTIVDSLREAAVRTLPQGATT